jgi:murein DD-endopeptidase MepM/ murein hydrolase activator NlpD
MLHPQLGIAVVLRHGNDIHSLRAHLREIMVNAWGNIQQLDTPSGVVGDTGASPIGVHLYFDVLVGGFATNPIKVIRTARNVQQIQ